MSELVLGNQVETRVIRMEKPTRKIWLSIRQVDPQVRNIIKPPLELVLERPSRTTNETVENSNETGEASLEI